MNRKLILLILCLPLILMLCLFSVSNTVKISISIPVSRIEIFGDKVVYLDFDNQESYAVDYAVYPINAKNKEVYFSSEQVGTSPFAELEYTDGRIVAKSCGRAKVYLTTVDGGFRDSFVVQVESTALQGVDCTIEQNSIYVGDTTIINTIFLPESNATLLNYTINDAGRTVVNVNANGEVTGLAKGTAEITVSSAKYPNVKDVVTVQVKNRDIIDFEKTIVTTWNKEGSVNISLDTEEECTYTCTAYNSSNEPLDSSVIDVRINLDNESNGTISVEYSFADKNFNGSVILKVKAETASGLVVTKDCTIECINQITAKFVNATTNSVKVGGDVIEMFNITPSDANVNIECELSNSNVEVSVNKANKFIIVSGKKLGTTTVTLKIYNDENADEFVSISKEIVVTTSTLNINESLATYGIENVFAIGKTEVDGKISTFNLTLSYGKVKIGDSYVNVEAGDNFAENLTWESTSANASIDKNGIIQLSGNGDAEMVGFKAVFSYQGIKYETSEFEIQCVYEGVNVHNYKDLWQATNEQNPKPIVLHNDIKEDFAVGVSSYYKEITTTYDKTYYKNIGTEEKAKIKVLIEFKNDVYGNGHTINAHNVAWTQNLQNAGNSAVFAGPLNFVAMSENGGMVSVKAQDNVCFAVYEGVTITNIELKGCDLQADESNEYDLNDLTYTGTTVEVFGDDVNIKYSRINNGRTVLRAFGDIKDSSKAIHLNIQNSVLSSAREFILRLGSNCFVDGTADNCSPTLPNDEIKSFPMQKTYNTMTDAEKAEYDNLFIKTFVNIKNSVFKDSGIFAIALDTHFAGAALQDGSSYLGGLVKDWHDLAKTSYGVKLTFEGDIRIYDWKRLDSVDSSTLIETFGPTTFKDISFDVEEMVDMASQNSKYANIVYQDSVTGTKYVHGGIAFFGGGKNYSVFDGSNSVTYDLNGYEIKLSDVGKTQLQVAAGNESFYFLVNDATTQNFLPNDQETILNSEDAYSCIYKK